MTITSDVLVQEGVTALKKGDPEKARTKFKQALKENPKNTDALFNLGGVEHYLKNPPGAVAAYTKVSKLAPSDYENWYNLGTVYLGISQVERAIDYFKRSIEINPYFIDSLNNLGVAFQNTGRLDESISILEESLRVNAENPTANNNLGVAWSKKGLPGKAIPYFQQAISLHPEYASAFNNFGSALQQLGTNADAVKIYEKALTIEPNYQEALTNAASSYLELGRLKKAIKYYRRALSLSPTNAVTLSHLVYATQLACEWIDFTEFEKKLRKQKHDVDPLLNIISVDDIKKNYQVAKAWSDDLEKRIGRVSTFTYQKKKASRINIGYINNFQDKPVAYLTRDLFSLHNKKKFKVFAFSYGSAPGGEFREHVATNVDNFYDLANIGNYEAARLINEQKIDILVDLKGYTKGHRMEIIAMRPAPIQISYLGFPGTTGASFLDYIITDKVLTPKDTQQYYREKHLYMPNCYQINSRPVYKKKKITRKKYQLPKDSIVFSSLNPTFKIDPKLFGVWMRILTRVPDSVLWLLGSNKQAISNLRAQALVHEVDPDRLVFAKSVDFEEHMNRIPLANITLDTKVYNGGATTAHTLWAGVPVVTLTGKHYLSRMGTSILKAAGVSELAVGNLKEYESIAVILAKDQKSLQKLKSKLEKNIKEKPLFDTKNFVRDLEKVYEKLINAKSPRS